jgi:flagellar secretion chaperone FliS
MDNRIASYKNTDTLTMSQVDLIIKCYDGTINQFTSAISCYEKYDVANALEHMEKARQALTHLYTTLDFEKGGEVAKNLGDLYVFMINQTNLAAATGDRGFIQKNVELMKNLREGWAGIRDTQTLATQPAMPTSGLNATA